MIRPIRSLDDLLISSYRASLSHHSYALLGISDKTDVKVETHTEEMVCIETTEETQKNAYDVRNEDKTAYLEKVQHTEEMVCSETPGKKQETPEHIEMRNSLDEETVETSYVFKFCTGRKTISASHGGHASKNTDFSQTKPLSKSPAKLVLNDSSSRVFGSPTAVQSHAKSRQVIQKFLPFQYRPHKVRPQESNTIMEDGIIININVKGLPVDSSKMSKSFLYNSTAILLIC